MGSMLLACCWLLPNHIQPWTSFHSDAWAGVVLAVAAVAIFLQAKPSANEYGLTTITCLLVGIPLVQYVFGLYSFVGQFWVATTYLLGFCLALLTGEQWQKWRPGQAGDFLFFAIGIAALASVGLQLQQWLGYSGADTMDVWVATSIFGSRPYANMGQANQLATLLLWGLLACGWGVLRGSIRSRVVMTSLSLFIFIGLALTQSRSGALGVVAVVVAAWYWRSLWKNTKFPIFVTALAVFYGLLTMLLPKINETLLLDAPTAMAGRFNGELRPTMWRIFWDAAQTRPFGGFGWNEVVSAQLSVADAHPFVGHPTFQSHNLFLDFLLWVGIPLGLAISIALLIWIAMAAYRIKNQGQAICFLMILVIGIHAMLELPLHYAYFLLPVGIVVGVLNVELDMWRFKRRLISGWRWTLLGGWALGVLMLGMIIFDYFKIEESYSSLQLESAGIIGAKPAELPQVLVLDHLREAQRYMKFEPMAGASKDQLKWAEAMVAIVPSPRSFMTYATFLGLNGRRSEAQSWLVKMCRVVSYSQCAMGPARWAHAQQLHPELAAIPWPDRADPRADPSKKESREFVDVKEP